SPAAQPMRRRLVGAVGTAVARKPSFTTSKSEAFSDPKAGFSTSLFQRVSYVPLMYMSDPLSATISPYRCIARKIRWTSGVYPVSGLLALSLSRAPIGRAPVADPARCDAG